MEETLFYVFGLALVLSALVVSALGLRSESFPSRIVLGGVVAYFVVLVGATSAFAVLNAREEQRERDAEHAEAAETVPAGEEVERRRRARRRRREPSRRRDRARPLQVSSPADGSLVFEPEHADGEGRRA